MRLVFGCDHAGFIMRESLATWAASQGHTVVKVGATGEEPYDYPIAADLAVEKLLAGDADFGVLVCGSGIGICIRANRHMGIRAAHCLNVEMAAKTREHNHSNMLCVGEREIDEALAEQILQTFLQTPEDNAERHVRRVSELDAALEEDLERTK